MRITLKDVVENAQKNDIEWLRDHKTRIKLIIKNEKLDETINSYLWNEVTLRREIVKTQKLPQSIIEYIFEKTAEAKKSLVSSSVFKETLIHQDIKDDIIIKYSSDEFFESNIHFDMWRHIPSKMISAWGDISKFKALMTRYNNISEVMSAMKAIIEFDKSYLDEIISVILSIEAEENKNFYEISFIINSLTTLSKIVYHEDHIVDKMYESIDESLFYDILHNLISRSNCSYLIQAKYLLNR